MDEKTLHVLLVEDNPTDALLLKKTLAAQESAFAFTHAKRLDEALQYLQEESFDVVLLDLGLPDSQGIETFDRMQRGHSVTPILILSGLEDEKLAVAAVRNGAQDFLVKGKISGSVLSRTISYAIERKLSEQKLIFSEASYRRLFESAHDGIFILEAETGKITDANPYIEKLLGYTITEFIGKRLWEIAPFRDKAANQAAFRTLREKGYIRYDDLPLITRDGKWADVEFISNVYAVGNQQVIQCNIRDISERKQIEAAEQKSKRFLQSTLDALSSHLAVLDEDGIIIAVNEAWQRFADEKDGDNISCGVGANYIAVCEQATGAWGREAPAVAEGIRQVLAGREEKFELEYPCDAPEEQRWFNLRVTRFNGETPVRVVVAHENISKRKQAAASLIESQQRLALATQSAHLGIWDWDVVANNMVWDAQMLVFYGVQEQGFAGTYDAWQNGLQPEDREQAEADISAALDGSRDFHSQFRVLWPNGEVRYLEAHAIVQRADDGSPLRMIGINIDITERKQSEQALRESEHELRTLIKAMPQIVWVTRPDGWHIDFNQRWMDFTGLTLEESLGFGWNAPFHPDDRARAAKLWEQATESGEVYQIEYRLRRADGSYRWMLGRALPLRDVTGKIVKWFGTLTDIHDMRMAEIERDRFFTLSLDMLGIADNDGYFKRINPAFETTFGFSQEELMAVPFLEFVHPDDRAATLKEMDKIAAGETTLQFENRYRCRDGSYKWLRWMTATFEDLSYFVAHDVTEAKQTEQTIRESEEYFRFLNDLSESSRLLSDPEQIMAVMTRMLGEHLSVSRCAYADVEANGDEFAIVHDYTDGCASTVGKYQLSRFGPRAVSTLNSGATLIIRNMEAELLPDEGTKMFQSIGIQAIIVCPLVKEGVLHAMMAVHQATPRDWQPREITLVQDVVERCWATIERRAAEEKIYQLNADLEHRVMERTTQLEAANTDLQAAREIADRANLAKSEFLSRMSHELRTPLNAILGFGQILNKGGLDPLSKESVGYILKGGRHLLDLINEVLDIARVEAGHVELSLEPIALNDVVPDACAMVRPLAVERSIRLQENSSELIDSHILADRQRLKQVMFNLLSNAIKYNRKGGQVQVVCEPKPEGGVAIAIHDTGSGISSQDLTKLFTPFERLGANSTEVEGTGLGLVVSQRLVTAMGGTLKVESTLGHGSIFTIELPQAASPQEQLTNLPKGSLHLKASKQTARACSILCIEDNPSNLRLIEAILEDRLEIRLLSAMQASVGLHLARQHEPDLILLDLNLPDLHGSEVLARLQQSALTRDIPVVVISADATPQQIKRLLTAGAKAYLTKPLDIGRFLHTLDEFLPTTPVIL